MSLEKDGARQVRAGRFAGGGAVRARADPFGTAARADVQESRAAALSRSNHHPNFMRSPG